MATLQNIGKLKYRGKDGQWHPLPVVVQDTGGGVSTISGKGAPTSETQGKVNQLYRDEDTQKLYICTDTDGGYTWAEVSGGGSVDVDETLTKAGQAADAKAAGDAIGKKIDKAQGTGNAGKILGIGADGNVTPQDKPVQALAGASAPTTATAGVVGQEYYVIVGNAVTEMYVCTAVANGTYTWDKVEFGAEESDPTVPAWAKEAQKPSYTASEVGADPSGTAASQVSAHNTGTDTHGDIRLLISGLTDRLNALADSDDTTLDQLSEVVAYIKSNRTLIEAITTSKVSVADIVDDLTTNVSNKPLSAAQGVALKALINAITVPDKLPNPNALTFTGAATGSYDGSVPVAVEIPIGGGGLSDYELIDTIDWSTEELAQFGAGKEYSFEGIQDIVLVYTGLANDTTTISGLHVFVNNKSLASSAEPVSGKSGNPMNGYVFLHSIPGIGLFSLKTTGANASNNYGMSNAQIAYNLHPVTEKITKFKTQNRVASYCTNMGILKIYAR